MRRIGQVIELKPGALEAYKQLHVQVWPEVLETIRQCNITNYSIFVHGNTLFAYFEYCGDNFEVDMARMSHDPKTQEWWTYTEPLQKPIPERKSDEWWTTLEEVFHTD